ncbi:MAG: ribosomal RNA small subunit methyltransferase A [Nitrospinae bacterium RIFCSPLOWO2_12_FULL_47_7]|nr:MAG: ribosomal RNA small subunit methyltransferase A [Nitrospinae bacterium RIFCSPLOWO2_12_FULL_47_7]
MRRKQPLGQNFLCDQNVASQIIELAHISPNDPVVEIGPGKGVLTSDLLKRSKSLTALEVDPRLCADLTRRFGSHSGFRLLQADASKFDYSSLGPKFKVVSNLPYYIGTPILKRLIHYGSRIIDMTLMLQKELVDRLVAEPGQKEYGSLTVFVQYQCTVERLLEVKQTCFSPPPKVDSSVIRVTPLPRPRVMVHSEKTFFKVTNAAFFHKRKMLKNNLKEWRDQFHVEQNKVLLAGIDLTRRGETLSLEDFATIANAVQPAND